MVMVTYKDFVDTFIHPALVAKSGINHGVDVIDAAQYDAAMAALKAEDSDLYRKIATFMASAPRPLLAGHYFPASGEPGEWYDWKAGRRDGLRWPH